MQNVTRLRQRKQILRYNVIDLVMSAQEDRHARARRRLLQRPQGSRQLRARQLHPRLGHGRRRAGWHGASWRPDGHGRGGDGAPDTPHALRCGIVGLARPRPFRALERSRLMLPYAPLHRARFEGMTLDESRSFRQSGARTAGHPEHGHAAGIDITTGPLGQGLAGAVGTCIAERSRRHRRHPPVPRRGPGRHRSARLPQGRDARDGGRLRRSLRYGQPRRCAACPASRSDDAQLPGCGLGVFGDPGHSTGPFGWALLQNLRLRRDFPFRR